MGSAVRPILQVKEINDTYLRRNFQSLDDYFKSQNQLLDFKFLDIVFTGAETNRKIAHGLGVVPVDLIRLALVGPGVLTFDRSLFDKNYLYISSSGACRVRMFVGSYFASDAVDNFDTTETEQWFSQNPSDALNSAYPIGGFLSYPSLTPPDKFLLCNAGVLPIRAPYLELYNVMGVKFNTSSDGAGVFRLPGPNGRALLYAGLSTVTGATTHTVGQAGGEETHTMTIQELVTHNHGDSGHAHTVNTHNDNGVFPSPPTANISSFAPITPTVTRATSTGFAAITPSGTSTPFNLLPPYLCIGYLMVRYLL